MSRPVSGAAALSIVVPSPSDAAALEATLVSVLENRPVGSEVVVPLGFAYDDPWRIADEVRFVPAPPGSGLAACANVGIAASTAPVVHVLAAGWLATPGWTDGPLDLFGDPQVQAVVPVGVSPAADAAVVSAGVRVTRGGRRVGVVPSPRAVREGRLDASRIRPAAPVLEAGFWRADVLAAVGPGFATCCGDWLADADMAAALAFVPGRVVLSPESRVVCGAGRRRPCAFTAGLQAERLFWRSLARGGLPAALAGHAFEILRSAVAAAPLGTVPMLVGRLVAMLQVGDFVSRLARLRSLAQQESGGAATVRIDGPHPGPSRHMPQPAAVWPLRRSA